MSIDIEVGAEPEAPINPPDCPGCLGPVDDVLDALGTCGSERCRRRAMQADAMEYAA